MNDGDLLDEQRSYYRSRASQYDDWWQRRGRYAGSEAEKRDWDSQVIGLEAALENFAVAGDVLELAGGTGWWTARLASRADRLTVLDGSPEALELNRERAGRDDIEWIEADVFTWRPSRHYDVVFFSFWLSHVPRERFASFWELVRECCAPGGRVFLIDNRHDPSRTRPDPDVTAASDDVQIRHLDDGTRHRVVKIFYEPGELEDLLEAKGWRAEITGSRSFIYGSARLPGPRA